MPKPLMNRADVVFDDVEENGLYTSRRGSISVHIGAKNLGYYLTVLPPGKAQCQLHSHRGEDEMFFILEGEGELRFGDQRYPLRKHDVIAARKPKIKGSKIKNPLGGGLLIPWPRGRIKRPASPGRA